jgi:hypothetical protein
MNAFAIGKKLQQTTYIEMGEAEKHPSQKQRLWNMCSYLQLAKGIWVN